MNGWMDGLTVWAVGQLDNWMNRCTKYFRIFEATTERKVDGKVSRKWEQTHARVVVVVVEFSVRSGPGQQKNLCRHNFRHVVYKLKVCPIRCSVRRSSLYHVASIFPYTSQK